MTTPSVTITRTIRATVKGKMQKEGARGPYLDVQVVQEGKGGAPGGGRFPETYKCWDPKQMEHVVLNTVTSLILRQDNVKPGREDDGDHNSYWWSIAGVAETPAEPDYTAQSAPSDQAPDIPPNPAALGACQNHAVDFIIAGITPVPEGRVLDSFIRELRDRFYRNINQAPLAPPHYCYQHEAERKLSPKTKVWGHVLEDGTGCVETPSQ